MKLFSPMKLLALSILICAIGLLAQDNSTENKDAPKSDPAAKPEATTDPAGQPAENKDAPKTEPAKEQSSNPSSTMFVNSRATFELKSSDDMTMVDYIEFKVNNGEFQKYSTPLSISEEGQATISYRAVDKAGNKEPLKALVVIVDNTPAIASISSSEPPYTVDGKNFASNKATYTLKAEDKVSGIRKIEYQIDNEPKQEYTGQPIKVEKPGVHIVKYSAIDGAGNPSPETSYLVHIDDVKPTVEIRESISFMAVDGKNYSKKGTTFTVRATDADSGVAKILVKLDTAADFVPYTEALALPTQGEHSIEAKAIDNVGNESEVKKISFFTDVTPPSTTITTVPAAQ